ncbi:MAG: hypothetical protein U1E65_30150 [Myxococcota bacterium]
MHIEVHLASTAQLPPTELFALGHLGHFPLRYVRSAPMLFKAADAQASTTTQTAAGAALSQQAADGTAGGFGTAGWNFEMDGQAYVLSNRHILRGLETDAEGVVLLTTGGSSFVADLDSYEELLGDQGNYWDLAIAQYREPANALAHFIDDPSANYPRQIADDLGSGDSYYKVGANSLRTGGALYGTGREIKCPVLGNGIDYAFEEQLYFEMVSRGGDSGSVVVRSSDDAIVGLLMASIGPSADHAQLLVANPLFEYGLSVTDAGSPGQLPKVAMLNGNLPRNPIQL